jgi:8-oxo-dGTP diphosphatase
VSADQGQVLAATVCFLRRNGNVLLQRRAPGRIWAGRLNGPGGKIAVGEDAATAIAREVFEETGLRVTEPVRHGALELVFGEPPESRLSVVVFTCREFSGRTRGREGRLRWYAEDRLPFAELWPDMRFWLPAVLAGRTVDGTCAYDASGDHLRSFTLRLARIG